MQPAPIDRAAASAGSAPARSRRGADAAPTPRPDWALFLDVDGVMAEIAGCPGSAVVPAPALRAFAAAAAALGGAVALASGRAIADLDRLFAPLTPPAAGLHGLELRLRAGGPVETCAVAPGLDAARAALRAFAAGRPGIVIEDKRLALALHYRHEPGQAAAAAGLVRRLARDSDGSLVAVDGKMVAELRPSGGDKGRAVAAFMAVPPFRGRVPVFVGDDVTDEDGFAAVNRMGGVALRVGPPPASVAATAAHWQFAGVPAFLDWLAALPAATGSGTEADP